MEALHFPRKMASLVLELLRRKSCCVRFFWGGFGVVCWSLGRCGAALGVVQTTRGHSTSTFHPNTGFLVADTPPSQNLDGSALGRGTLVTWWTGDLTHSRRPPPKYVCLRLKKNQPLALTQKWKNFGPKLKIVDSAPERNRTTLGLGKTKFGAVRCQNRPLSPSP